MAAALAAGMLAGCETTPWQKNKDSDLPAIEGEMELLEPTPPVFDEGLPLSANQRFSDIPLPVGVDEDFDRTYVFESRTMQVGRMVYTSRESVNELAKFYIRECPAADWKLQSSLQAEAIHLQFSKPGKRLEIRIQPQGVGRHNLLILNLTPVEGASAL